MTSLHTSSLAENGTGAAIWVFPKMAVSRRREPEATTLTLTIPACSVSRKPGAVEDAPDVYPFRRRGKSTRVVPVEVLSEVESKLLTERDEQMVLVEVPRGRPLVPDSSDIDNEATVPLKDAFELLSVGEEPTDVPLGRDALVGLLLLEGQRKGW